MVCFPPCKINLGLNVVRKRSDGYHDIVTCFYPVPWSDVLEIIPSKEFSFTVSGDIIPGDVNANLCVKAYRLLEKEYPLPPVSIHLHKIIPTGAGLGGGSSDAAWTLRVLNDIFSLDIDQHRLKELASALGSDCAFFIDDIPMMGEGRGEVLSHVQPVLKGKTVVIVKPEVHVSTAQAYSGIIPTVPVTSVKDILEISPITQWPFQLKNDFEQSVIDKFPVIGQIKDRLYSMGAAYASMSGSGSAVFGIFDNDVNLEEFEEYEVWKGRM